MENRGKNGFSIIGFIAQVLVIVIFVFVLMWLFPTKSYIESHGGANNITNSNFALSEMLFNQNLLSMKDAAREYFTIKRMPATNGGSKTLTLEEMVKNGMVVELFDANGEKCDQKASFVKVTKVDSEYEMEISLTCGEVTKTIKTIVGCYNYCESGLCEKQGVEVTLYQYAKTIKGTSKWSNWSEWSKKEVTKTKTREVETKTVNELIETKTVITPAEAIVTYSCPNGYTMSTDKKTCTGTGNTIPATLSYYCETGVLRGNQCYLGKITKYEYAKKGCASGSKPTVTGTQCESSVYVAIASVGFYETAESCRQAHGTCAPQNQLGFYYYCPATINGVSVALAQKTDGGYGCFKKVYSSICPQGFKLTSDKKQCQRGYQVDNLVPARSEYKCSTGTLSGKQCILTTTISTTANTKYTCNADEKLNASNQCEKNVEVYGNVTYYRYRTYTTTKDTVVYKWSKSNNDTSLIKAGYKLTGKTKTTTSK